MTEETGNHPILTNEQRKILNSRKVMMEISLYEAAILKQFRVMSYGSITVHFLDGVPLRYTLGAQYAIDPTGDVELLKEVAKSKN